MNDTRHTVRRPRPRFIPLALGLLAVALILPHDADGESIFGSDYDVNEIEESAGMSLSIFRSTDGDVYGGGYETGVRIVNTPIMGEIFGHWLSNDIEEGNFYSVGVTLRLMPRWDIAPFAGGGAAYNGLLSDRSDSFASPPPRPAQSYWSFHVEGGLRLWFGTHRHFIEGTYRQHYSDAGSDFAYGWVAIEYGRQF